MRVGTGLKGRTKGYTVLEVMIFLAVSGFMFVIAASFVSGKQASAEFRQGMNDVSSQMQQIINDVGNGYYPSSSDFICTASSSAGTPLSFPAGTPNAQGSNQGCVFMGRVVQFGTSSANQADETAYAIFTVAGRQYVSDPTSVAPSKFSEAQPVGVDRSTMIEYKTLQWNTRVYSMYQNNDPNQQIGAVGFFSSFGGGTINSGAQITKAVAIPGSVRGQAKALTLSQIQGLSSDTVSLTSSPDITVCFKGNGNQYGRLAIGGGGQGLVTSTQITNGAPSGRCPA